MGVPDTSQTLKPVILFARGFPFLHSIKTRKPSAVPKRMESTVISRVVPMPSRKSFQRDSRRKVFSKLEDRLDQKEPSGFFSVGVSS